jgi:hypothetical protein
MMITLADKLLVDIETIAYTKIEAIGRNPYWEVIRKKFSKQLEKNLKFIFSRRPAGGGDYKSDLREDHGLPPK